MLRSGVVVCLEARTDTILERLFGEQGADEAEVRPLLQDPSPRDRIDGLKAQRQPAYALAHWTVHTDGLNVDEVAREVVRAWDLLRGKSTDGDHSDDALAAVVHSSAGACPIYVGWGLLDELGQRCRRVGLSTTAYLVSDETVFRRYGRRAQAALEAADIPTHTLTLPAGETSKTLEMAGVCYGWLAERRAGRRHFIVALGGGVIGDLAGFVAATFNRGMPFVQVPTSLAAMVDASIGGKTAVDLPQGKNLVGAFHQPRLTLAEMDTLTTLSPREMAAGWAEAIKHGLILDADLLQTFEEHAEAVQALETPLATDIVRRSTAIKANVVSQDERETLGVRALLNYGHTLGHALEAATGYGKLLHGEAVAVGMTAAVRISRDMGLIGQDVVDRQDRLLERFGLPTRCPGVDRETVRRAMGVDKKAVDGTLRWVLLEGRGPGHPTRRRSLGGGGGSSAGGYVSMTTGYGTATASVLRGLLEAGAPEHAALRVPGGPTVSYDALRRQVDRLSAELRGLGVQREDRVAMVLPNSLEALVAFLAVSNIATAAPLNPAYKEDEFRFYMEDTGARALVLPAQGGEAADQAASDSVLRITVVADEQGEVILLAAGRELQTAPGPRPDPDDVALVLHTSGTTSRPKRVPLTHANLLASVRQHRRHLRPDPGGRLSLHHAPVPRPRAGGLRALHLWLGGHRRTAAAVQRPGILARGAGARRELVLGGAHHAPGAGGQSTQA